MLSLSERIVAIHASLDAASLPHAFGGALALAFHVQEPRATRDIDVNVFVEPQRATEVFEALPAGVVFDDEHVDQVAHDGQTRLLWDDTPVDLFFSTHPFHDVAQLHVEQVPFAGTTIPVLGATELMVFKAYFDRGRDWVDLETMVEAHSPDVHAAIGWLVDLLGPDDHRVGRLRDLLDHRPGPEPRFRAP
jgi:hypothetical protein